ncbi:hypothetical protein AB7M69_006542 [Bradyrhizobium japonicum]
MKPPITQNFSNEELAIRFAADALAYLDAARSLEDSKHFPARYHLFCQAIELLLKSFILASGGDQSELLDIGHKLNGAMARAKQLDFVAADDELEMMVDWLDPYHRNHHFRYSKSASQTVPGAEELALIIETTHAQIEPVARAAWLKANPPPAEPPRRR